MKKTIITRGDGKPYLVRYTLFTCKWFSVKVHNILSSDDVCLHDHPWAFISIILKGGYEEQSRPTDPWAAMALDAGDVVSKRYGPGTVLYRKAQWAHRLVLTKPAWTLVITFKKTRMWGFFTPKGWLPWFKYRVNDHEQGEC
jgi:hypothetical protein